MGTDIWAIVYIVDGISEKIVEKIKVILFFTQVPPSAHGYKYNKIPKIS